MNNESASVIKLCYSRNLKKQTDAPAPHRFYRQLLLLTLFFISNFLSASAAEEPREKKVFAHHMGSLNAGTGAMWWHSIHADDVLGGIEENGGDYRNYALAPYAKNIGNHGSADLQIRRALRIGIDGFAVNAWAGGQQTRDFLDALFAVAEEKDYPFEITLSLDPATLGAGSDFTEPDGNLYPTDGPYGPAYQQAVNAVQYLLDHYGDSPKLARRDGKPLIFGYMSGYIGIHYARAKFPDQSDGRIRGNWWGWSAIGEGIRELENQVNEPLYLQFCMQALFDGVWNRQKTFYAEAAENVARHVDAVGEFLPLYMEHANATPNSQLIAAAQRVTALGKEWSHPAFFQYDNNRNNMAFAVKGTDAYEELWRRAREHSTLIQYSTWNDYHEATNLSPGYDTRYAVYDLAEYYISWWKEGAPSDIDRDKVYIFSRKYPLGAHVFPFQKQKIIDGVIEVVTTLTEPALVHLPNRGTYEAPAGYFSKQFPVTPGPVAAELWRDGELELRLDHPEPVTDRPFRQDNGITAISTEFMRHWIADFGEDEPPLLYSEYGDADGDGLPNWFEMYWFGKFLDMSTATGADPDEDANNSGRTNFQEYLLQRDPLESEGEMFQVSSESENLVPGYSGKPFHDNPAKIPGRIQAQDYDHGGQGIAYFETIDLNQGLVYRRKEQVDIGRMSWQPDPKGGEYYIAWTRQGEWMNYTVEVQESGNYDLHIRHVSFSDTPHVSVSFDGVNLTGSVNLPNTGGLGNWGTTIVKHVPLDAGIQVMQVRIEGVGFGAGFDLNYLELTPSQTEPEPDIQPSGVENVVFEGDRIELRAVPPTNNISRMFFKVNGQIIGETCGPDWTYEWGPVEPGEHSIQIEAIGLPGGVHRSEKKVITVSETQADLVEPLSFDEWKIASFPEGGSEDDRVSGFTADPDGDGVPNLLEYALGGDPNEPGTVSLPVPMIETAGEETFLTLSFDRPRAIVGATYEVQTSKDLSVWETIDEGFYNIVINGKWETVSVRTPISKVEDSTLFKRLKVTPKER